MQTDNSAAPPHNFLFLCRPGYEAALRGEITAFCKKAGLATDAPGAAQELPGILFLPVAEQQIQDALANREFVFERQRLIDAVSLHVESIKTCAHAVIGNQFHAVDRSDLPWTLHAFTPDVEENKTLGGRVKNIADAVLEKLKKRFGRMFRRYAPPQKLSGRSDYLIVQLCMDAPDHVYVSVNRKTPHIHAYPGGEQRMRLAPDAPSRSYLKLSEALTHMPVQPRAGQSAADLGAAPGGWTYYLLQHGIKVTAVDNGALKIDNPGRRLLTAVKADGMSFTPPDPRAPFDWLCCDMLVPPRQTLELLQKWMTGGWMRYFVINVKLPQKDPVGLLGEIQEYLAGQNLAWSKIKHLYHDREEITLMGQRR